MGLGQRVDPGLGLTPIRKWVSIKLGLGVLVLLVTLMRWTT